MNGSNRFLLLCQKEQDKRTRDTQSSLSHSHFLETLFLSTYNYHTPFLFLTFIAAAGEGSIRPDRNLMKAVLDPRSEPH